LPMPKINIIMVESGIPQISLSKKDWKLREDIVFLNHGSYGSCPRAFIEE